MSGECHCSVLPLICYWRQLVSGPDNYLRDVTANVPYSLPLPMKNRSLANSDGPRGEKVKHHKSIAMSPIWTHNPSSTTVSSVIHHGSCVASPPLPRCHKRMRRVQKILCEFNLFIKIFAIIQLEIVIPRALCLLDRSFNSILITTSCHRVIMTTTEDGQRIVIIGDSWTSETARRRSSPSSRFHRIGIGISLVIERGLEFVIDLNGISRRFFRPRVILIRFLHLRSPCVAELAGDAKKRTRRTRNPLQVSLITHLIIKKSIISFRVTLITT